MMLMMMIRSSVAKNNERYGKELLYIYLDLVGVLDFHEKGIFVFFFVVDASRLIFMRQQMCFPPPRPRSHLRSTHRI